MVLKKGMSTSKRTLVVELHKHVVTQLMGSNGTERKTNPCREYSRMKRKGTELDPAGALQYYYNMVGVHQERSEWARAQKLLPEACAHCWSVVQPCTVPARGCMLFWARLTEFPCLLDVLLAKFLLFCIGFLLACPCACLCFETFGISLGL